MKPELKSVWADTHSSNISSILFLCIIKIDLSHYYLMPGMQPTSSVLPAAWAAPSIALHLEESLKNKSYVIPASQLFASPWNTSNTQLLSMLWTTTELSSSLVISEKDSMVGQCLLPRYKKRKIKHNDGSKFPYFTHIFWALSLYRRLRGERGFLISNMCFFYLLPQPLRIWGSSRKYRLAQILPCD